MEEVAVTDRSVINDQAEHARRTAPLADDARLAETRIRTYLDAFPDSVNLGVEFAYSAKFRSEDWPHEFYPLLRTDLEALLARVDQLTAERDQARDELTGIREWADAEQASRLEYVDREGDRWLYLGLDGHRQPLMQIAPYRADDEPMRLRDLLDEYGPLTPMMPEDTDA